MRTHENLVGRRFDRLKVVSFAGRAASNRYCLLWRCACRCGGSAVVSGGSLRGRYTRSCGCLQKERTGNANRTHGKSGTREYYIWRAMKQRCESHPDYAGRGIRVCSRWLRSFEAFITDMGQSPAPGFTIERLNNSKGYSPGNCAWVSQKANNRNKRNNRIIEYAGRSQCVSAWAEELGVPRETLKSRLARGWDVHEVINGRTPR
jgi:hypothetical protein